MTAINMQTEHSYRLSDHQIFTMQIRYLPKLDSKLNPN